MNSHPMNSKFLNPFRPGAGHMPPYLAGRDTEKKEFLKLISQSTILENMVLTGLRGVGKTVLLDTFKPMAMNQGWLWVGTDLSESASISEANLATRILADLSVLTSGIILDRKQIHQMGFSKNISTVDTRMGFDFLSGLFNNTPGLISDRLKNVLEAVWSVLKQTDKKGLIFAYDEAQNLSDHPVKDQYPLGILLDVFQSIQKKSIPFLLVLTGLPTLFPKLVESRTFAERMFRVVVLKRLNEKDSEDAILRPVQSAQCPIKLSGESVSLIVKHSGGYPYFIQFICRETYDVFLSQIALGKTPSVPVKEITRKLDTDFFAGRWARATDRQRELLWVIAQLPNSEEEFSVQEVVEKSKEMVEHPFSPSHANQMLSSLSDNGLVYKNRHGKYSLAVPLLSQFILRQHDQSGSLL
jgi:hypothetical protein